MDPSATASATQKFFQWQEIHPDKRRLFDGLTVSAIGCGSYLGASNETDDRLYEQALFDAGQLGVNFFDTAINYRCMRSEKILGRVIKELSCHGIGRDQLVIATKGGYLTAEGTPEQFDDYVRVHYFDTGLIAPEEVVQGCHCISPAFLEEQIASSLKHLNLECIDLYYLHNPETQLQEVEEEEFYLRLKRCFDLFEKKVKEKKIKRYGIATWNGFRQKSSQKILQLSKVLECAKAAGGESHHFKAVQMPYNLVMLEAIKLKNQLVEGTKERKTILEAITDAKLFLMVSAPLMQSQILHLPSRVFEKLPAAETLSLQALQFVLSTAGIVSAIVGMKDPEHVRENLRGLHLPNWSEQEFDEACSSLGIAE